MARRKKDAYIKPINHLNIQEVYDLFADNKSGSLSKEFNLKYLYPELHQLIISWSIINNFVNLQFKEQIYLYVNQLSSLPLCKNCNIKVTAFKTSIIGYNTFCCNSCAKLHPDTKAKLESTLINKYGTTDVLNSREVKERIKQNNLVNIGYEHHTQMPEFKESQIKRNQDKFGKDYQFQADEVKTKIKKTHLERRGVEHHSKTQEFKDSMKLNTPEAQEKAKNTLFERYGVTNPMKSPLIVQRSQNTNKQRYGVSSPSQNLDILNKMKNTTFSIYGVDNYAKTQLFKDQHAKHAIKNHSDFYDSIGLSYIYNNKFIHKCDTCHNDYEMKYKLIYWRHHHNHTICTHCNPLVKSFSQAERDIYDYIINITKDTVEQNNTKILNGLELDIFIPNKNLAIEYNGLYWHSDLFKDYTYHYDKTRKCENLNINLIHIYENDWNNYSNGIKNIISHNLGCNKNICINGTIKLDEEVNQEDILNFLLTNSYTEITDKILESKKILYMEDTKIISIICYYDNTILGINRIGYIDYTKKLIDSSHICALDINHFNMDNVYNIKLNNFEYSHRINPDIKYQNKDKYVVYNHGKTVYIKK